MSKQAEVEAQGASQRPEVPSTTGVELFVCFLLCRTYESKRL